MNPSKNAKIPLLVIVGPTASGKSDLAVRLAKNAAGEVTSEIISADSRQVYIGLNIGTGKITREEMQGVPHHLLDVADPHERFTAMDWKKLAEKAIADIHARGRLPIICGGTGFYISTVIDDLGFPNVKASTEEQKRLEAQTSEALFEELKKLDPHRAASIDLKNKRRLARAIIIARELGSVPAITRASDTGGNANSSNQKYDLTMIGVSLPDAELKERIRARLVRRLDNGMIQEVERLHAPAPTGSKTIGSLSYERMDELGLEYKYIAQYLQNKMTRAELTEILATKIWQYARRQKTWFKKDAHIKWMAPSEILATFASLPL
jgi:tRNA dimethylallyltransferase